MEEINVQMQDLPEAIKGFTVRNGGEYTIILNSRHCREQNIKTYQHELKHILGGDFERTEDVNRLEKERHA